MTTDVSAEYSIYVTMIYMLIWIAHICVPTSIQMLYRKTSCDNSEMSFRDIMGNDHQLSSQFHSTVETSLAKHSTQRALYSTKRALYSTKRAIWYVVPGIWFASRNPHLKMNVSLLSRNVSCPRVNRGLFQEGDMVYSYMCRDLQTAHHCPHLCHSKWQSPMRIDWRIFEVLVRTWAINNRALLQKTTCRDSPAFIYASQCHISCRWVC